MNIQVNKIQEIIDKYKLYKKEAERIDLLQKLEGIYLNLFDNKENRKVIEEKELKELIKPLSIDEFFNVYQKIRGFAIVRFVNNNNENVYGIQRDLLERDIKAVKSLINCKQLENSTLAESLYLEMQKRYKEVISIIDDFYNLRLGEYEFGLIRELGDILEEEISDYFA